MIGLLSPAIVIVSFLAIVQAAIAFNRLDVAELFPFSDMDPLACLYMELSCGVPHLKSLYARTGKSAIRSQYKCVRSNRDRPFEVKGIGFAKSDNQPSHFSIVTSREYSL